MTKKHVSLTKRTIRCILFDFGDTLWTRNIDTYELMEERANLNGARVVRNYIDPQRFPSIETEDFGRVLHKTIGRENRMQMRQKVGYEPDFAVSTLDALEELGLPRLDYAAGAAIFEALRIRIPESRLVFPDTFSTLTELQARGYILGVVTNRSYGGQPFVEDMRQIGFDQLFDLSAMAVSADLGIRKPNPDIFLYALNKLGIPANEAAMVGDSLHADIQGANLLDILSIWRPKRHVRREALISAKSYIATGQAGVAELAPEATQLHENDDDQALDREELLRYVRKHQKHEYNMPGGDADPDHIIYTLSELLELF